MPEKSTGSMDPSWVSWDSSYELGIPVIDEQHKQLVALCDKFHGEMLAVRGNAAGPGWKAFFSEALRETAQYASTHFSDEERVMELAQYPNIEFHKECHREFITTVSDILNSFNRVTMQTAMEFSSYLKNWVLFHIAYEDRAFQQHVMEFCRNR